MANIFILMLSQYLILLKSEEILSGVLRLAPLHSHHLTTITESEVQA